MYKIFPIYFTIFDERLIGFSMENKKMEQPTIDKSQIDLSKYGMYSELDFGYYWVSKDGLPGIIDDKGNNITPENINWIDSVIKCERIKFQRFKGWGFIDLTGSEIIPPTYGMASSFNLDLSVVLLTGNNFIINKTGEVLVNLKYDVSDYNILDDGLIKVKSNKMLGYIDLKGQLVIPIIYDECEYHNGIFIVKINNKYGMLSFCGDEIIPLMYSKIDPYSDQLYKVSIDNEWGLIDLHGTTVLPLIYDDIQSNYFERRLDWINDFWGKVKQSQKFGIIDIQGKLRTEMKYSNITILRNDHLFLRVEKDSKYGVCDLFGNPITEIIYDEIGENIYSELIYAKLNGKFGVLNIQGQEVIQFNYDEIGWLSNETIFVQVNNRYILFNNKGDSISKKCYDDLEKLMTDKPKWIKLNGFYGFINSMGEEITLIKYDTVESFICSDFFEYYHLNRVVSNGKHGLLNSSGQEIFPCIYNEKIYFIDENLALVKLNGKYGLVDSVCREIFPCIYDTEIIPLDTNIVLVKLNGEKLVIMLNGEKVTDEELINRLLRNAVKDGYEVDYNDDNEDDNGDERRRESWKEANEIFYREFGGNFHPDML